MYVMGVIPSLAGLAKEMGPFRYDVVKLQRDGAKGEGK